MGWSKKGLDIDCSGALTGAGRAGGIATNADRMAFWDGWYCSGGSVVKPRMPQAAADSLDCPPFVSG